MIRAKEEKQEDVRKVLINETKAQRGKNIRATQADILIAFAPNVITGR